MSENILLKNYCPAVAEKNGISADDIQDNAITTDKIADGAVTASKFADALKSVAIANLDSEAALSDVITAVNSILVALRTFGIIAPSE